MAFGKFWNENEPFDATVSHDFEPTEEFRLKAIVNCQTMTVNDSIEETEKMHKCNHFHWRFCIGVPSCIIGCKECAYWEYF